MNPTPKVPTVSSNWWGLISANALDEGLMIGGRGRQMNSKVKDQTNKPKLVILLRQKLGYKMKSRWSSTDPLGPFYRPGLEVLVGFNTNLLTMTVYIIVSLFEYTILWLLSWAIIFVGLNSNIYQGYQCHGPWQAYPCHPLNMGQFRFRSVAETLFLWNWLVFGDGYLTKSGCGVTGYGLPNLFLAKITSM
jgi:hypothetical protein